MIHDKKELNAKTKELFDAFNKKQLMFENCQLYDFYDEGAYFKSHKHNFEIELSSNKVNDKRLAKKLNPTVCEVLSLLKVCDNVEVVFYKKNGNKSKIFKINLQ